MIASSLRREIETMVCGVTTAAEGRAVLQHMARRLAEGTADLVFLKVQTEPGWQGESLRRLIDACGEGHGQAIAETVHAFGGTVDEGLAMADAAASSFHARLRRLMEGSIVLGQA